MQRDVARLAAETFDVVIVGGGITGAAIAHDAALRGLTVALIERGDFGAATSAASSKLLHSGIRFLQQLEFRKVRESSVERAAFQRIAPHLSHYLPFVIPTYRAFTKGRTMLAAGVVLHRLLCMGENRGLTDPSKRVPRPHFLSRSALLARWPVFAGLGDVTGAWVIYESHMYSSERMTLAFLLSAASRGAAVVNYASVENFDIVDGAVRGVRLTDVANGQSLTVAARVVVNAAGPWLPALNHRAGELSLDREVAAFAKGVHVITRPLTHDAALAVPTRQPSRAVIQRGGRHLFVIPWRGLSLIGTTNVPFGDGLDELSATGQDIDDFVTEINLALPAARLTRDDVRHAFAGLYPLTDDDIDPARFQGHYHYQVIDHAKRGGPAGLISALGTRFTTARGIAAKTVDFVISALERDAIPCRTTDTPLAGGKIADVARFEQDVIPRSAGVLSEASARELARSYGVDALPLVDRVREDPRLAERLTDNRDTTAVQVVHAVEHECALTVEDVVFRRTGLGTIGDPGDTAIGRVADVMGGLLGWDAERCAVEAARCRDRFIQVSR